MPFLWVSPFGAGSLTPLPSHQLTESSSEPALECGHTWSPHAEVQTASLGPPWASDVFYFMLLTSFPVLTLSEPPALRCLDPLALPDRSGDSRPASPCGSPPLELKGAARVQLVADPSTPTCLPSLILGGECHSPSSLCCCFPCGAAQRKPSVPLPTS